MPIHDTSLLQMALAGCEVERQKVQEKIAEIKRQLNGRRRKVASTKTGNRRGMSAAGRKRIVAAQRKRWAEFHKKHRVE
jgi:hypothetical protein